MRTLLFLSCIFLLISCTSDAPETADEAVPTAAQKKILIVGGDQHHDFDQWFNQVDSATLTAAGFDVTYTDNPAEVLPALADTDLLYLSNNQALSDSALRQGIFHFADAGKGLLLVHPALWYNWADWPEYNRELAGGGSRSHGPYGPFEVSVTQTDHPIMANVPASFTLEDELYRYEVDPEGPALDTLMIGTEPDTGDEYPLVWTVTHPTRRIVGITIGHDGASHESDAYKALLTNAANWLVR